MTVSAPLADGLPDLRAARAALGFLPLAITPPAAGVPDVPVVIDSPHSGTHYPATMGSVLPQAVLREGEDAFVDQLWDKAPAHGASLLAARFPRVWLDPNRGLGDIDEALLDAPWPGPVTPSRKTELGIGLVWRLMDGVPMYDRRLSVAEVQSRIDHAWRPYHQALATLQAAALQRHGRLWHLNVHSMPDDSYRQLGLPEKPLADFVLGTLDGRTADEATVSLMERVLRDHGYSVARDDPFKGVEIIRVSGDPARKRHAVQVEVKRSCYMDAATHQPHDGFARVKAAVTDLVAALAAHARAAG
jgi:N-formylglutamate deformylase